MTAQAGERLLYNGKVVIMASEPLNQYLIKRNDISFVSMSTACWRGYHGEWEIKDNKLYLIGLKAYLERFKEVGLDYLFPGHDKVFADWFSGHIRIPQGEMLYYIHMGYASLYERDLFLVFENGILVDQHEIDNEEKYKKLLERKKQNPQ